MSVAYRSGSVQDYNSGSGTTSSIVINAPVGLAQGDYIFCTMTLSGTPTVTPPTGWFIRGSAINLGSGTATHVSYYKPVASGSEPSTYTFGLSTASKAVAEIVAFTGADKVSPNAGTASTSTTGTTTVNLGVVGQTESGYVYRTVASENTTAPLTVTSGISGMTQRDDQSTTTSSPYAQVAISDGGVTSTRLDSQASGTATLSASAVNATLWAVLRPDATQIVVPTITYYSSAGVNNASSISPSLAPPFAGTLYFVISINSTTETVSSITSSGLTFTQLSTSRGSGTGRVELWSVVIPDNATRSYTISFTGSVYANYYVYEFAAASGIGAIGTNSGTGTAVSTNLTTTAVNSLVMSAVQRSSTPVSVGGSQTLLVNASTFDNLSVNTTTKSTSIISSSGTSVTHTLTNTASVPWAGIEFEILQKPVTHTQTAIAKIAVNLTKTQPATARIAKNFTKTQSAVSRVATVRNKTQPAVADIAVTLSTDQYDAGLGTSKTQTAKARIANDRTKTQSTIARIAKNFTKTQPAVATISQSFTATQQVIARIIQNPSYTPIGVVLNSSGRTTTVGENAPITTITTGATIGVGESPGNTTDVGSSTNAATVQSQTNKGSIDGNNT